MVRLVQIVSLDWYVMKELLMLNDTLMKYSIHFSLIWRLHTQIRKPSGHYMAELSGEDRIICKGLWPPRSPDLNPCDFYFWESSKSVVHANNSHDLDALKQNIREAIYNICNVNCNKFSEICLRIQACLSAEGRYFEHLLWWWLQY
jgi:hypothetical protein